MKHAPPLHQHWPKREKPEASFTRTSSCHPTQSHYESFSVLFYGNLFPGGSGTWRRRFSGGGGGKFRCFYSMKKARKSISGGGGRHWDNMREQSEKKASREGKKDMVQYKKIGICGKLNVSK